MTSSAAYAANMLTHAPGWGRGYPRLVREAAPAAGNAFVHTVGSGYSEQILSIYVTLTTSATVANRAPRVEWRDQDAAIFAASTSYDTVPAGGTVDLCWVAGLGAEQSTTGGDMVMPLPLLLLPTGFQVWINPLFFQSGDQLGSVALLVERFPTGPYGPPGPVVPLEESAGVYGG